MVAAAACGRSPGPAARLRALVTRAPKDTVRFVAPASAHRCGAASPGGVLLHGATGGNGVIVWLRDRDSLATGDWPVLQRGDSSTPRGAVVGVRFVVGDVAHGVSLDSGAVSVTRADSVISLHAGGSGLELAAAARVAVDARFEWVPLENDTVPCLARP